MEKTAKPTFAPSDTLDNGEKLTVISSTSGPGLALALTDIVTSMVAAHDPVGPIPEWAMSYVQSVEFQKTREFLHHHLGESGEPLHPLTSAETLEQAWIVSVNCTIETAATMMQLAAELAVYRAKYGFLDGSPFAPDSTYEVTILDGCRFRPAVNHGQTTTTA